VRNLARRLTPQVLALLVGVGFIAFGIMGFIPGVMHDYDQMKMAGHDSDGMWLGVGQLSYLHNVLHLTIGAVGLLAAWKGLRASVIYLVAGGVFYGLFGIYGLVVGPESQANWAPTNGFDDTLHLVAATFMIGAGIISGRYFAREQTPEPVPAAA
jgi:hypothetical protein